MKTKDLILRILTDALIVVIVVSSIALFYFKKDINDTAQQFTEIQNLIDDSQKYPSESQEEFIARYIQNRLDGYRKAYDQNNDMVGWIKVVGTTINYPVMQRKDIDDYYLRRAFDKSYSMSGTPYVKEDCNVFYPSDNVIIYGHSGNGLVFSDFINYRHESFYKDNKYIEFSLVDKYQTYEVIAAFSIAVNTKEDKFKYYNFVDAYSEEEFNNYINNCKYYSYYQTDATASYGDKLITISTCDSWFGSNQRFVVVAKLIDEFH